MALYLFFTIWPLPVFCAAGIASDIAGGAD
jgi:hypothetical protein